MNVVPVGLVRNISCCLILSVCCCQMSQSSSEMNDLNPLTNLPTEILQVHIGRFCSGSDLNNLSQVSRRLYCLYNIESIWAEKITSERLEITPQIQRIAEKFHTEYNDHEDGENCLPTTSILKLKYLVAKRIKNNISNNKFKSERLSFGSSGKICCNENFLVVFVEERILAWDITEDWSSVTQTRLERSLSLSSSSCQTDMELALSGSTLLLCFSYSHNQEADFQCVEARDLDNDFNLLWEKSGLLGCHIHTVKIISDHLYIFDFLADRIEVYGIREKSLTFKTFLGPMSEAAKIPCGDISGSVDYLAVPGKSHLDNGPVVCTWHTQTGAVKVLRSDRPTCPYRFFRKTAVSAHNVLGLLDRLRLLCWDARTGGTVFTVELTSSGPRENMAHTWLTVNTHFVLTVHQDLSSVSVLSSSGSLLTTILPSLPLPHRDWLVKGVTLRGTVVFIRLGENTDIDPSQRASELEDWSVSEPRSIIVSCDLSSVLDSDWDPSQTTEATVTTVRTEQQGFGSGSVMFANDTKLFDLSSDPLVIHVFNYFNKQ